ncbi:MAG: SpoIID/LytB domain-containing protein [Flavobacteriales bacterium]
MIKRLLSLFLTLTSILVHAQDRTVSVGLLQDRTVRHIMVMSTKGNCSVFVDGERIGEVKANDGLLVDLVDGKIKGKSLSLSFTANTSVELVPQLKNGGFRLRSMDHKLAERSYPGSITISKNGGAFKLVDTADIEAYTEGVVKAEAGNKHHVEYYKLQSVSCRTYALSNSRKHALDGYQLCDGVHCQVFHGVNTNDSIHQAVEATKGLVLVDPNIKLIHATFHSNCGGETVNAEDLWSKREPYLRATKDTFCLASPHATWKKTLTRKEWLHYLNSKYKIRTNDKDQLHAVLNYTPECRDLYLANTWPLVPLKNVREDLKLRSTFFSVHAQGDNVVLEGRGFGHGVGLCQEGSMRMARSGLGYMEILHHYYKDVHLVDVSAVDFFRAEDQVGNSSGATP